MKKIAVLFAVASFMFFAFNSCKKETVTNTVTVTDTVCIEPAKRSILIEKEWQIDELYRNSGGVNTKYIRGGTNTTGVNYQNLRFRFLDNGSGTYIDEANVSHTLNWNFVGAGERNATLTVGPPSPATFEWNLIEIEDNYLHCTTAYGGNLLLTVRYIQVP